MTFKPLHNQARLPVELGGPVTVSVRRSDDNAVTSFTSRMSTSINVVNKLRSAWVQKPKLTVYSVGHVT